MIFEIQYSTLVVGLVPASEGGALHPFLTDALQKTHREITADYPYADFQLIARGGAAQLSNGPRDFVTLDPRLLQIKTDIDPSPAIAQAKTVAVLSRAAKSLEQSDFAQCGIQINARTPTPPSSSSATSFITDELLNAGRQARVLGPDFFACPQFRQASADLEQQLSIEPLLADQRFLFLGLDLQRNGPQHLNQLDGWLAEAFDFLRNRATKLLNTHASHSQSEPRGRR